MKAIVVKPGEKDTIHMRDMPDPKMTPDEVAVKMLRVGLCGTDAEINRGLYGKPPDGDQYLILGHENLGIVEDVGKKDTGHPDIVIEATGSARVVFDAMEILGPNGVLCLLSVTGGDTQNAEPIDLINQRLVLGNQVVFGSVNANPRHFKMGVKDFVTIQKKWPGVLNRLLTNKIPWQDHKTWFTERGSGIKSTLEIQ